MSDIYYSKFKCRLCGEIYVSGSVPNKETAYQAAAQAIHEDYPKKLFNVPSATQLHTCDYNSGRIGIADFIGYEREDYNEC